MKQYLINSAQRKHNFFSYFLSISFCDVLCKINGTSFLMRCLLYFSLKLVFKKETLHLKWNRDKIGDTEAELCLVHCYSKVRLFKSKLLCLLHGELVVLKALQITASVVLMRYGHTYNHNNVSYAWNCRISVK
jgi:hypothetical protein